MPNRNISQLKEKVRRLPESPGVYMMKDRFGEVLYVGKAKNLKRRVSSYFQASKQQRIEQPKIVAMIDLIHDFDIVQVRSDSEAILLEGRLIKERKPRYNTDFTDDKRFLLVRLDRTAALPTFRLVRFRHDEHSLYYGPFAHSGPLRKTLAEMRLKFGILLSDSRPMQLPDGRWKLYEDIRAELYGHPNIVTEHEYGARIDAACAFMEGKSKEWLAEVEAAMTEAAAAQNYERAAELRDILLSLRQTIERTRKFTRALPREQHSDQAVVQLGQLLQLPTLPMHIECFDISHISGTFCVASMVCFREGKPDKSQYRRFRIRSFTGNDDFRAMEEVVGRRYRRLDDEQQLFPDLIVIDGGKGQLTSALRAFIGQGLTPPPLIGLAKKEETIVFTDHRAALQLPIEHPARRLLQKIRDEAHRFANAFNADWRSRRMRETILDDFSGLGPQRKQLLLNHFKTLQRLRQATLEELQEVDGIGPILAARLLAFLREPAS